MISDVSTRATKGESYDANLKTARIVHEIAAATHATPGQIALAWLLNKGDDIVPIPGTKRRKFLEENVAAANLQLNPDQMKTLDDALAPAKISGKRYTDWILNFDDAAPRSSTTRART
jgi:aryl-alcohol dehydrogenase-like predicted oxidoreductase